MAYHNHHSHVDCIRLVPIFNHLNDEQMHLIAQSANEEKNRQERCWIPPASGRHLSAIST